MERFIPNQYLTAQVLNLNTDRFLKSSKFKFGGNSELEVLIRTVGEVRTNEARRILSTFEFRSEMDRKF